MNPIPALQVAFALLVGVGDAAAHATLLESSPADGSSLAAPPAAVVLRFDEPVAPLAMRLVDAAGAAHSLSAVSQGQTLRVPLPSTLRPGAFVFTFRVMSADSHPVAGSISFAAGDARAAARAGIDAGAAGLGSGWSVLRALRDIALLACAGAALFSLFVGAFPLQRRVLCAGAAAAALMTLLGVGMQAAALADRPLSVSTLASPQAWQTSAGVSALCAIAASMAIAGGALVPRGGLRRALLGAGALAAPASLALTGHAASAEPGWLSMSAVAAHAVAAAFWFGSLVALWLLLSRGAPGTVQALRRFSAIAVPAVILLVGCGTVFAAMQLGSLDDLVRTRYGNMIVAKAGLLALLLVIAAGNRFVLMPRFERTAPKDGAALRRAIELELTLVVVVVGVTAVLSRTPP